MTESVAIHDTANARIVRASLQHEPLLEAEAISAWCLGLPYSQASIARAMATRLCCDAHEFARSLPALLDRLESRGVFVGQKAATGSKDEGAGFFRSIGSLNWSPAPIGTVTLRDVVGPYLTTTEVSAVHRQALRSALRAYLSLPFRCTDAGLLNGCTTILGRQLYDLPHQLFVTLSEPSRGLERKTIKNHRSAIRRAMRWAATRRLIPIEFPPSWPTDPWLDERDRYLPLAKTGTTSDRNIALRSGWRAFGRAYRSLNAGTDPSFQTLTREEAEATIRHLQRGLGEKMPGYQARRALRFVSAAAQRGPYATRTAADGFTVSTPSGPRPAVYLRNADGSAGDGDWEQTLALLAAHGVPSALTDFLRWYHAFITLPAMEIMERPDLYPSRRERTRVSSRTLECRLSALRAILGVALQELPHPVKPQRLGLALDASTMTPEFVFGAGFRRLLGALIGWWRARGEALGPRALGASATGSLRQMVIALSMMCLGWYEYLRHQRNAPVATSRHAGGPDHLDWKVEEGSAKSVQEQAAWDAYRDAGRAADVLLSTSKSTQSRGRGKRANDFKNIQRILETTPPSYWIRIHTYLVEQVRSVIARKQPFSREHHQRVCDAILLGLLISTGCRIDEICNLSLSIHLTPDAIETRTVALRACDRKNQRAHTVRLHEAFVPFDILQHYLTVTRPHWMRARETAPNLRAGNQRGSLRPCRLAPHQCHDLVLVSERGVGYGDDDIPNGTEVTPVAVATRRAGQAGSRFTRRMARHAHALGLPLPMGSHEGGAHSVRGACGYAIYLAFGVQKAAHYLGDAEETVSDYYSALSGVHVDPGVLLAGIGGERRSPEAVHPSVVNELALAIASGSLSDADRNTILRALGSSRDNGAG